MTPFRPKKACYSLSLQQSQLRKAYLRQAHLVYSQNEHGTFTPQIRPCTFNKNAIENSLCAQLHHSPRIGNLHMRSTGTHCYGYRVRKHAFSSPDFSAGRQNITQHGRSPRQYDKGIGVRVGGGSARNDVDAHAGETLIANRLNGCFQSRLFSLYNLWFEYAECVVDAQVTLHATICVSWSPVLLWHTQQAAWICTFSGKRFQWMEIL